MYTVDSEGKPVPVPAGGRNEFLRWYRENDHTVAFDVQDGVKITTTFLGVDAGGWLTGGPPILWETSVIEDHGLKVVRRYTSQADALVGHAGAVGAVFAARQGLRFQRAQSDRSPELEALRAALQSWAGPAATA